MGTDDIGGTGILPVIQKRGKMFIFTFRSKAPLAPTGVKTFLIHYIIMGSGE